ncbi:MAG: hypothetical protein ACYTG2_15765 [Planctomycetota bacterium]|jgi:predicted small secreted protein
MNKRVLIMGGILAVIAVAILVTMRILEMTSREDFLEALWKVLAVIAVVTGASLLVSRLAGSGER